MYECYKVDVDTIGKIRGCSGKMETPKNYVIRDKVYLISLYKYGEGEPPFHTTIVFANNEEDAMSYYHRYKSELPRHNAISIRLNGEENHEVRLP